jgi:molybdopterin/thiamine biosynthesis adenylyltransferase
MQIKDLNYVIVIGAGGTGSILIPLLGRYLLSQDYHGRIIIADGDQYTESNLDRQLFAPKFSGKNKAEYQCELLYNHIPAFQNKIIPINKFLSKQDIDEMITDNMIIINCADNNAIRKYVEDKCDTLQNVAHICCGNELFTGQVQASVINNGNRITSDIYKNISKFNSTNDDRSEMSCEELAKLPSGGQLICANAMAAVLALNYLMQITSDKFQFQDGNWLPCDSIWFNCENHGFIQQDPIPLDFDQALERDCNCAIN